MANGFDLNGKEQAFGPVVLPADTVAAARRTVARWAQHAGDFAALTEALGIDGGEA